MKVYIGPYEYMRRSRIFSNYMDKKYTCVGWPDEYSFKEKCISFFDSSLNWIYDHTVNLFVADNRKVKVRIDDYDTWSMDHTVALVVAPLLKQLAKEKHGYPNTDGDDAPHIGMGEPDKHGLDSKAEARWDWILSEMIWAFDEILEEDEYKNYYDPYAPGEVIEDPGFFGEEVRRELGKFNKEKCAAYEARKSNGFRLFGKYFENLWD